MQRRMSKVKNYVHAKFCQNKMSGIQTPNWNVICGVKFGWFLTFDQRPQFLTLRKNQKSTAGLFPSTRSISMLTFVEIWGVYYKIFKKKIMHAQLFCFQLGSYRASLWELKAKQLWPTTKEVPKPYVIMPRKDSFSKKWNYRTFCYWQRIFINIFAPESSWVSLNAADKINIMAQVIDPIHRFRQKLAWACYLTIKTSLCKNLSKFKIADFGNM